MQRLHKFEKLYAPGLGRLIYTISGINTVFPSPPPSRTVLITPSWGTI